ncbi:hypothetical protein EI94DRAFT_1718322 [Lactarius quietus]|nr:hypothetical protein EI94DRAFT_1718322 [Lactarius quietus]
MDQILGETCAPLKPLLQQMVKQLDDLKAEFEKSQQRLPMQLHNAIAHPNETLHYPPQVAGVESLPQSKMEMFSLEGDGTKDVAQALGLPSLPPDASEATQRQQIFDFLGLALMG